MWMACATFDEIAEATDCDKATASRVVDDLLQNGGLAKTQQAASEHAIDFDPPIYNIWKQQEKTVRDRRRALANRLGEFQLQR
jgi:hypothetical protein